MPTRLPVRLALVCLSVCFACGASQPESPSLATTAVEVIAPPADPAGVEPGNPEDPSEDPSKDPATTTPAPTIPAAPMNDKERLELAGSFATANNKMSFDLLRVAGGDTSENVALSAASIELALAMTAGGARGETLAQIRLAMGLASQDDPAALGRAVMAHWAAEAAASKTPHDPDADAKPAVILQPANRLYGERSYTFEQDFIKLTEAAFGAPLEPANFMSDADGVRGQINKWVGEQTRGKIDELLPARSLDSLTRLVLVNALYFKGRWATQFETYNTADAPFFVAGKSVNVPTMKHTGRFKHRLDKDIEILGLPYGGGRFSMMIVMPTGGATVESTQKGLTAERWEKWRSMLGFQRLELSLPRFVVKPKASIKLKDALGELGMKLPFSANGADFRGIANPTNPDELLYIAEVYHQAVVEVDEHGTEAAAATAVVMKGRGAGPAAAPPPLKIDRPFLFSIYDEATGAILFLGRVTDPRGEK